MKTYKDHYEKAEKIANKLNYNKSDYQETANFYRCCREQEINDNVIDDYHSGRKRFSDDVPM